MELDSLTEVNRVINEHNTFLTRQIEDYRQYLQNVRMKAGAIILEKNPTEVNEKTLTLSTNSILAPNISVMESSTGEMRTLTARFTHHQLEREGVIVDSNITLSRRLNIYISIVSPEPGSFLLSIFYRGRKEPLAKLEVTLDDLLEKKSRQVKRIDVEYFQLDVKKLLLLLQQVFILQKK